MYAYYVCYGYVTADGLDTHEGWSLGARRGGPSHRERPRHSLLAALSLAAALRPATARFVALGLVAALAAAFVAAVYFFFVYMRVFSCFVFLLCFTDFTSVFWPATPRGDFHEIA